MQWADRVLAVSSTYKTEGLSTEYGAAQALGPPSILPQGGATPAAWQPAAGAEASIRVGFARPEAARQLVVCINSGAGGLARVYWYGPDSTEHLAFTNPMPQAASGQVFNIPLKAPYPAVSAVRVVVTPARVRVPVQVDAIGLSTATEPFVARVNVAPDALLISEAKKTNLGAGINSSSRELNPVISPDGRTLYFTRWGHPQNTGEAVVEQDFGQRLKPQDIWRSELTDRVWKQAVNLGPPLNNADHNALCSISADGKTALLLNQYLPGGGMAAGVSISHRTPTGWSFPEPVKIRNLNMLLGKFGNFTEYALSADRQFLLMAISRADSRGHRDLYVSFPEKDGSWSEPRNLGPDVNTALEEGSPFLAADGRTLYFSTEGFPGYGNKDIFMARRLDDSWQRWSRPENLGPAINTPGWDGYFTIEASGHQAYLSSDIEGKGNEDIFRVNINPSIRPQPVAIISGKVTDGESQKPIPAQVFAEVLVGKKEVIKTEYDPETGEYKVVLPMQKSYLMSASKDGYVSRTFEIDLRKENEYREIRQDLSLSPLRPGVRLPLTNIFFPQGDAGLLPESAPELGQLVRIMRENPRLSIRLEGHTDNRGDYQANVKLSEMRVNSVKNYLVSNGIASARVKALGFGPARPVAPNASEEDRRKNRRVELIVLSN